MIDKCNLGSSPFATQPDMKRKGFQKSFQESLPGVLSPNAAKKEEYSKKVIKTLQTH